MRVLILWADDVSPNLGVRALGAGTAALVKRVWPTAELSFQNYGFRVPQLPIGRVRSLVKERVLNRKGMQEWLASHDLVLDTRSGDSFADIYGLRRLMVMSTVAEFASQAKVPVVLGPQTIGPFHSRTGRTLGRRSLRRSAVVMARDSISAEHAGELGRTADVVTTDVVFALPRPATLPSRDVVLNISGLLWFPNTHVDFAAYRSTVTRLYRTLRADGRTVTLLAHVLDSDNADSDMAAIREFSETVAIDAEVVVPTGLDDVRETVASAEVVIGSRMHACLNALSVGTPAIPLAYSRKFMPLLTDLGWQHTVDLRTSTDPAAYVLRELATPNLREDADAVVERAHVALGLAEDALRVVA